MKIKLFGFVVLGILLAMPAVFGACGSSESTDTATGGDTGGGGSDAGCMPKCDAAACGDADGCGGKCSGTCPEGKTCSAAYVCDAGQTFTATLTDFQTKGIVENVNVEVYDDETGEATGIKGKTDANGKVALTGIPASKVTIGIMSKKANYLQTLQYHFTANATDEKILIVSQSTVSLIATVLGVTPDDTKGVAAGGVFWGDRSCSTPIGCATVTTDPAGAEPVHYFDDTGFPTKTRDALGTNKLDGLFTVINTTPGKVTITATVGTANASSVLPNLPAHTLAISNVYFDKATYTTDPTPATCAGNAPDGGTCGGDQ